MNKKLNSKIALESYKKDLEKVVPLTLEIGGEKFVVNVKQYLSEEDKNAILIETLLLKDQMEAPDFIEEGEEDENYITGIITLALIKVGTDIDFGSTINEQADLLLILDHYGYMEKIVDSFPKRTLEHLAIWFTETAKNLPKQIEKEVEKREKENKKIEEENKKTEEQEEE